MTLPLPESNEAGESGHAGGFEAAPGVMLPGTALSWRFARSSGPGGQNVNKVATKAELLVSMDALAERMPGWAIDRLTQLAGRRIAEGTLRLSSEASRSQSTNRKACLLKLRALLLEAMNRPKPRRPTRPSKAVVRRRLEQKKQRGQVKRQRREGRDVGDA